VATRRADLSPSGKTRVPARRLKASDPSLRDGTWWGLDGEKQRGQALWDTVQILNKEHAPRHFDDAAMVGLYRNQPPYWSGARRDPLLSATVVTQSGQRVPMNLVKSVIDTAAAMLSKNTAELRAFTSGGSWRDQRKAKQITKFNSGAFYLNGYHRHQQRSFRDGCLTRGRGAVQFWGDRKAGAVRCARVHPRTLLWNDLEGDNPNNLYQWQPIAREVVLRRFPEKRAIIEKCPPSVNPVNPAYKRQSAVFQHADLIDVASGWHNGFRNEEDSGRYIVQLESGNLWDKPYPCEMPPFATFSWDDEDEGWGGIPLADTLAGYQSEISQHLRIYRKALMRAAAMAGAWFERTSEAKDDATGDPWADHYYVGKEPVFAAPPALGADFFQFIMWQYDKAFAEAGFSQLQAQGTKPEGLDAAVALREYNDITATRQVPKGQRYERQTEDAGKIQMQIARELYTGEDKVSVKVAAPGTKFLEGVDFSDIADMEEDAYVLKQSATSSLPTHFVGKMQAVAEMIRSGLIPKAQVEQGLGLRLMQMPDLEKEIDIQTSTRDLAYMQVDEALYEGRYLAPEPYQDVNLLLQQAQNTYNFAKTLEGVPRKNMRLLERLISEADAVRKRARPPELGMMPTTPAAQAMAPGMPPQIGAAPGQVNTQVIEQPAVPLQQPAPLPSPAVPSAVPA
jgi:hypothetical protein